MTSRSSRKQKEGIFHLGTWCSNTREGVERCFIRRRYKYITNYHNVLSPDAIPPASRANVARYVFTSLPRMAGPGVGT